MSRSQAQARSLSLKRVINAGLDLLFPPRCGGCGRVDAVWCARCAQQLADLPLQPHTLPLSPLRRSAATGIHDGLLQHAVHTFKYRRADGLAAPLADRLIAQLAALGWTFDLIVPVPLYPSRQRERGYNQAQLIAAHVAQVLDLPCDPAALTRLRDTPPQVGRSRPQRQANVRDAFAANSDTVRAKTVLLIDDVMTTGATLQACAHALRAAQARAIYSLTVTTARSPLHTQEVDDGN